MTEQDADKLIDELVIKSLPMLRDSMRSDLRTISTNNAETTIIIASVHFAVLSALTDAMPPELHGLIQGVASRMIMVLKAETAAAPLTPFRELPDQVDE